MPVPRIPFAIRVDLTDGDRPRLKEWLDKNSAGSYLAVAETHDGENPHAHVVVWIEKKLSGVRTSFKRAFEDKVGNSGYSLKPCDDDVEAYMRYMCKGNSKEDAPDVICSMGLDYTDEKVAAAHEAYWVNNSALTSNKKKRKAIPNAETVIEKLELACKEKGVKDKCEIAKMYIRMMRDARKPINTFAAKAVVNTVSVLLDDTDAAIEALANTIAY